MVQLKGLRPSGNPETRVFQFLMVQLKARNDRQPTCRYAVSIPYGTIKSNNKTKTKNNNNSFQFLMVQLKGTILDVHHEELLSFNSLWYN